MWEEITHSSIPKLQRYRRWSLGMDKLFQPHIPHELLMHLYMLKHEMISFFWAPMYEASYQF